MTDKKESSNKNFGFHKTGKGTLSSVTMPRKLSSMSNATCSIGTTKTLSSNLTDLSVPSSRSITKFQANANNDRQGSAVHVSVNVINDDESNEASGSSWWKLDAKEEDFLQKIGHESSNSKISKAVDNFRSKQEFCSDNDISASSWWNLDDKPEDVLQKSKEGKKNKNAKSNNKEYKSKKQKKKSTRKKIKDKDTRLIKATQNSEIFSRSSHSHFSTSYGSLSLGGAASLSSDDTFNNSPVCPTVFSVSPRGTVHKPKKGIHPSQPILKKAEIEYGDNEMHHSPSHYQKQRPENNKQTIAQQLRPVNSSSNPHSLRELKAQANKDNTVQKITTINNSDQAINTPSTSSIIKKQSSTKNKSHIRDKHSKSRKKIDVRSKKDKKISNDCAYLKPPLDSFSDLLESSSAGATNDQRLKESSGESSIDSSMGSTDAFEKCYSDDADAMKWPTGTEESINGETRSSKLKKSKENVEISSQKTQIQSVRKTAFSKDYDNSESRLQTHSDPAIFLLPPALTVDGKPRSAYDKNADWYCGSDMDDGSIVSDGSSVLSAFRTRKKEIPQQPPPQSEASMDFDALLVQKQDKSLEEASLDRSFELEALKSSKCRSPLVHPEVFREMEEASLKGGSITEFMNCPIHSSIFVDIESIKQNEPTPSHTSDSELQHSIPQQGDQVKSPGAEELDKKTFMKKLTSRKSIFWIAFGLVMFLILDIILLTIFMTRDGHDDNSEVLAFVPESICLDWVPASGMSKLCSASATSLGGGVPNLLAQAIRVSSPVPVDFSLIPAGLTSSDISKGDFTKVDAASVISFSSTLLRRFLSPGLSESDRSLLVTLSTTGLDIRELVSKNLDAALGEEREEGNYPYASGLRFAVDRTSSENRLASLETVIHGEWTPLEDGGEYTIITVREWASKYLKIMGDEVEMTTYTALVKYAKEATTLVAPEYSTKEFISEQNGGVGATVDERNVLATVPETICLEWIPGEGVSNFCSKEETSMQGGGVGNVVAWGVLDQLQEINYDIDIFVLNAGDCQIDIEGGFLYEQELRALLPHNHDLVFVTVTGEQLLNTLEQAIDYALVSPQNSGSYPYAAGLRFKVKAFEKPQNRVFAVEYFTRGRWKSVAQERLYKVATTLPLADGEEPYGEFYYAVSRTDPENLKIRNIFLDYTARTGTLTNPPLDKYSTQSYLL